MFDAVPAPDAHRQAAALLEEVPQECVLYHLRPGAGPSYDAYHAEVWPEVRARLAENGFLDYSIFRRGDLVVSVYRRRPDANPPELDADAAALQERWRALMAEHFESIVDEHGHPLLAERVFRLD